MSISRSCLSKTSVSKFWIHLWHYCGTTMHYSSIAIVKITIAMNSEHSICYHAMWSKSWFPAGWTMSRFPSGQSQFRSGPGWDAFPIMLAV